MTEGKIGKSLKKLLKKVVAKEAHEQLAISDAKLGGVIKVSDLTIIFFKSVATWYYGSNMFYFSGKDGTGLYPQPCSGWTDEMHQESDREPRHWTPSQGDQCHVSGISSQVDSTKIRCCCCFSAFVTTTEAAMSLDHKQLAVWNNHAASCLFCSLSRYKLKFSPDKVDTMIVQAICKLYFYTVNNIKRWLILFFTINSFKDCFLNF